VTGLAEARTDSAPRASGAGKRRRSFKTVKKHSSGSLSFTFTVDIR